MNKVLRDAALEDLRRLSNELTEASATAGEVAYAVDVPGGPSSCGAALHEVAKQLYESLHAVTKVIRRVEELEDEPDE